ncbi:hypothetical protein BU14_0057s0023 [Porphyra umbilicalis]|uniref:Uncharacterized protein n=1 Tax=Porphyra umbilicalis TaxID=2786 RepID=A0A1X6PH94_PORUM|nr:hypothetical protein BU14_0057s0023 [Porphyra umbilicalis]|eukprot:OSX80202.1 hypothetical protein BU14_0057s0023 [Porphyra umbilicalis]
MQHRPRIRGPLVVGRGRHHVGDDTAEDGDYGGPGGEVPHGGVRVDTLEAGYVAVTVGARDAGATSTLGGHGKGKGRRRGEPERRKRGTRPLVGEEWRCRHRRCRYEWPGPWKDGDAGARRSDRHQRGSKRWDRGGDGNQPQG